jgi:N-glycosidase YbiA
MINSFSGRYSFLSNFYPCEIEYQGIKYPTVEAYYVAMKVNSNQIINGIHYSLNDFREMISKISTPGQVKRLGRKVSLRKDWNEIKLELMNWAVREKFKDENLKELLLSTGDQELIEGNTWNDTFWGVCNGKGKNHLGKILMKVRDELRGIKRTGLEEILR